MFENVRADLARAWEENPGYGWWGANPWAQNIRVLFQLGTAAVMSYRFCNWAQRVRIPIVRQVLIICAALWQRWTALWTGVGIAPNADIGPGLVIHTAYGIHIGDVKIGKNCTVQSGVLIGCGLREVGDNVYFGNGAKAIGDTRIGNNVVIMPNSLVLTDVPDNTTVVGVPARIKLRGGQPRHFPPARASDGAAAASQSQPRDPSTKE